MIGILGRAYRTGETPDPADVRGPHAHNVSELESENETSFQLLLRARSGDEDALERLCARYLPRLHRWARGRLPRGARSAVDTGDIVQEVLIKVIRRIPIFEPRDEGAFQGYLRLALSNRIRDEGRRFPEERAQRPIDSAWPSPGPSPLEAAIGAEGVARYEAALARLKTDDQRAIVARCEWGMSHDEVAQILGKNSANAARVATHRALVRLAKEMADAKPNTGSHARET
jgi:RNA polymerase sigma factor (sigma-70 family)